MHSSSIQTGDAYLKSFLVGTGTLASPSSGSLLAANLFQSGHRTLLVLWWDEYDPAPILFYGPMVKQGFISPSDLYDEYSILHTMENNWALPTLTANDAAASPITEIYGSSTPPPGGSGGNSNGNCLLCSPFPGISNSVWLIVIGGLIGLVASLALLTIRARANLGRSKGTMN
jgi:hypothetical protein